MGDDHHESGRQNPTAAVSGRAVDQGNLSAHGYDGTKVEYGKELGIEFDLTYLEMPVVDFTPSPALASILVYRGSQFPEWQGNLFVASLKAQTLYRVELGEDMKVIGIEQLLSGISRIRDVKQSVDGYIDLLLENEHGGKLIRLTPVQTGK